MPYLSLTTWSLHRHLGPLYMSAWDSKQQKIIQDIHTQPETIALLDLPAQLAAQGFKAIEICHFNFPRTDQHYLQELRQSVQNAGITFYSLLIDYGDISSADVKRRDADLRFNEKWIDIAAQAGAERVRVMAGDADPDDREALQRSVEALHHLAAYGREKGVRVVTENFKSLTSTVENCLYLLEQCPEIGFTADFGNFSPPEKYAQLAMVVPASESIHAKAHYDRQGMLDEDEFKRCLDIADRAGYDGPFTLVYDGPGDMWKGIERVRRVTEPYVHKR